MKFFLPRAHDFRPGGVKKGSRGQRCAARARSGNHADASQRNFTLKGETLSSQLKVRLI